MFRKTGRAKKFKWDKGKPETLFVLEECLGEGTYGTVWTGTEKSTGRTCAVKIVMIDDDLEEIQQEIDIMRDSHSPYIVKFYGCYWGTKKAREEEKIWMIMEHCVAGSINDLMYVCDTVLNVNEISAALAGICLGLQYLHDTLYVIHRDIKAGNVLLSHEGYVRLADFGVSARLKGPNGRTDTAIGAPFWMAPEVIEEQKYSFNADIWSMGITVIELAESRPPLSDINPMQALFEIPKRKPPTLTTASKWPAEMQDFIATCLNKNPKARPSAKQMRSHEFIASTVTKMEKAKGKSSTMQKLVKNSLKRIEAARRGSDESSQFDPEDYEEYESDDASEFDEEEESDAESISAYMPMPETIPSSMRPKSEVPVPMQAGNRPKSELPAAVRASRGVTRNNIHSVHLNPLKDRIQSGRYVAPLRDTFDPNSHKSFAKGNQKNLNIEDVAQIVTRQQEGGEVMAGIMNPEFIRILKTIHTNDPDAFGGKSPSEWTSVDITKAVTGAMLDLLSEQAGASSGGGLKLDFGLGGLGAVDDFIEEEDLDPLDDSTLPSILKSRESNSFDDLDI